MAEEKLSKFELARVIGARALQISMGAPILIKNFKTFDVVEIAKQEFEKNVLPITIKRTQ